MLAQLAFALDNAGGSRAAGGGHVLEDYQSGRSVAGGERSRNPLSIDDRFGRLSNGPNIWLKKWLRRSIYKFTMKAFSRDLRSSKILKQMKSMYQSSKRIVPRSVIRRFRRRVEAIVAIMISLACCPAAARASSISGVHILYVVPINTGVVNVYLDTARSGLPTCASSNPTIFVVNISNSAGQAIYSAALTAFASNLPIDFAGAGACDITSNIESVGFISVHR